MPQLIGLNEKAAEGAVKDAGLRVGKKAHAYNASVPAKTVALQEVPQGTSLEPDKEVNFTVSNGPAFQVSVPNLAHQDKDLALKKLGFHYLTGGTVTEQDSPDVAEGKVISQNPPAHAKVDSGTPIDLVISKGPAMVTVPVTFGLAHEEAKKAVQAAGLLAGPISTAYSATSPVGTVISQNPEAGLAAAAGTAVQFVISSGSKQVSVKSVPPVVALTEQNAKEQISKAGLVVAGVSQVFNKDVPAGQVISQFPAGGSYLDPHVRAATVNLACSIALLLIGFASIAYGKILMRQHKKRK
jgi:beta-lactam-binding protein with PASTA domain